MAVICLLIGVAVGYLVRGSGSAAEPTAATAAAPAGSMPGMMAQAQPTPEQLKHMADKQAEPLLKQLQATPNDPAVLTNLGNLYYDAQQYQDAITYYNRALQVRPNDTNVRTDMGTAYWYLGNADRAIQEFQIVLKTEPTKANTLLNLGVVQWQGKMNTEAALAAWQKLLETNPNFEGKDKVQELMAQAKKHVGVKPGTKTDKPAM
jgi:tetratricopeptide (TPR) repeat protein